MLRKITLQIGKKRIGFRFGLYFIGEMIEQTGKGLDEVMADLSRNPFKTIPDLMYYSAKYYEEREGNEFKLTKHQLAELIDENGGFESEGVSKFLQAFTSSLVKNVPKEEEADTAKKKKK